MSLIGFSESKNIDSHHDDFHHVGYVPDSISIFIGHSTMLKGRFCFAANSFASWIAIHCKCSSVFIVPSYLRGSRSVGIPTLFRENEHSMDVPLWNLVRTRSCRSRTFKKSNFNCCNSGRFGEQTCTAETRTGPHRKSLDRTRILQNV